MTTTSPQIWTEYKVYQRMQSILNSGPSSPSEHWIYELAKYFRGDCDAMLLTYDAAILKEGFRVCNAVFPTCPGFCIDVDGLIAILPVKDGEEIERKLLIDLILESARECGMCWWSNGREWAAVVFGVMHACMIHRRTEDETKSSELSRLMGDMELECDEIATLNWLANNLANSLQIAC